MTRTHPTTLVALGLLGVVAGYLVELGSAAAGKPIFVPPLTLAVTLIVIAAVVIALAVPIRRAVTGTSTTRIDPFRATRIAALAKASALAGGVLLGVAAGLLLYLLTRSAIGSLGPIWLVVASVIGAVVLMIAGLVAEFLCTLPPDDTEKADEAHA
ncbi:DUF3180 domain-containing protein [Rathayibacter sp. YIM 133350]|uniref:DUF3180 domain-containing protein n=1 Tax=Rathayibacter sp. YIM 133350 TaxID=3131992 RepID=UPI00307EE438